MNQGMDISYEGFGDGRVGDGDVGDLRLLAMVSQTQSNISTVLICDHNCAALMKSRSLGLDPILSRKNSAPMLRLGVL